MVESSSSGGFVDLAITQRCNQRCVFCYEEKRGGPGELSFDEVKRLVRDAATTHDRLVLCGKEALLRPDILDVIRYAVSLERSVVAFTNGQVLARPGFIEALVQAGLAGVVISFHFPDAQIFARGAQVRPQMFDRILRGMNLARDYNRTHPEARLHVAVETDMFELNRGRLAEMRELLQRELGDSFDAYTLGGLTPVAIGGSEGEPMLEPFDERLAELAAFATTHPPHVRLRFTKTALCLLPGQEHRSLETQYVFSSALIRHNLYEAGVVVDDDVTVSAGLDLATSLRENPYRWLCRTCALVRMCRSGRTSWVAPGFLPTREQKPHPVHGTTASDVLARWRAEAPDEVPEACEVSALEAPVPGPTLEERLLAALEPAGDDDLAVTDAWLDGARFLAVQVRVGELTGELRLGHPVADRQALGFVVQYLDVVPLDGTASSPVLAATLERLATASVPPLADWEGEPGVKLERGRLLLAAWSRLGRRLWPGQAWADGAQTVRAHVAGDTIGLRVEGTDGVAFDLTYTPFFRGAGLGAIREVVTLQQRGRPLASARQAAQRRELAGLFPGPGATVRGPVAAHGRTFDLVVTAEVRDA